jgi:hypothetical protein
VFIVTNTCSQAYAVTDRQIDKKKYVSEVKLAFDCLGNESKLFNYSLKMYRN